MRDQEERAYFGLMVVLAIVTLCFMGLLVVRTVHGQEASACTSLGGLPDAACTPGATDPRVTQDNIQETICMRGYTATVRPPVSVANRIKTERMAAYGLQSERLRDYELDHLISLELGGAPQDVTNLWPEPWTGEHNAHEKDALENYLHREVCGGHLQLVDAQQEIATDWVGAATERLGR